MNAEIPDRQIVVVLRAQPILAAEQFLSIAARLRRSLAKRLSKGMRNKLPPCRNALPITANEQRRRLALRLFLVASIRDMGMTTALVRQRRAQSVRRGTSWRIPTVRFVRRAKRTADCLRKNRPPLTPFRFTHHPNTVLVAADIEQRNSLAERAGIGSLWQLSCRCRHYKRSGAAAALLVRGRRKPDASRPARVRAKRGIA